MDYGEAAGFGGGSGDWRSVYWRDLYYSDLLGKQRFFFDSQLVEIYGQINQATLVGTISISFL